jgi:hypothetical protein
VNPQGIFTLIFMVWIVGFIVTIWALVDAVSVSDDSMYRTGTKLIWVLIILLGDLVGSIVYFAVGRPEPGAQRRPSGGLPPSDGLPPPPPPR